MGLRLWVMVRSVGRQDRDSAKLVLAAIKGRVGRLALSWADLGASSYPVCAGDCQTQAVVVKF